MEGIFYCGDVSSIGLLQEFIPVSQALSDEQVSAPLNNAYNLFIRPLLGDALADSFIGLTGVVTPAPTEKQLHVLELLRRATANLAFWYSFTELNTHITDQGFQRIEGDTHKPVYRYQELELKQQFRNKGFNAIDALLRYLQANTSVFSGYLQAPAYVNMKKNIVQGPEEIDRYCYVNGSYLVFLKLAPSFRRIMETYIEPTVGEKACSFLYSFLDGALQEGSQSTLAEQLRIHVAAVVVCKALSEHVRNIGEITDRGLYYTNIQANAAENQNLNQASDSERSRQAAHLDDSARQYLHRLIRWVENNLPDKFAGHPEDVFNRDNDQKHTFWA